MTLKPRRGIPRPWWETTLGLIGWYGFGFAAVVLLVTSVVWVVTITR